MSDHHEERGRVRAPVDECLMRLREIGEALDPHLRPAAGALLESLFFQLAIENCAMRVLREERARVAVPPAPPAEALEVRSPLREERDPHDRPTVPTGFHGLRKQPGAGSRKPTPKGSFHGP